MKATISGVEEWSKVTLIPETEQEILTLEQFAEGGFNNVREYRVKHPLDLDLAYRVLYRLLFSNDFTW